ncbi:MAG TPA: cell division protein FtsQ/DivIB, partial [Polyangia bacterium]|nr:cell division protein FtsQ/DivIB [Polyangia bacterium]
RVRRELPAALVIDLVERRAVAAALLGGLYLLDASGRPFKRATLEEADGLVVVTGVSREQYANFRAASEGAFREALAVVDSYRSQDALATRMGPPDGTRPGLSEVHIDPRFGFSLFLYDGGGEIRLGRGGYDQKLARLDEILTALGPHCDSVRVVHLDGPARDRVPVRLAAAPPVSAGAAQGSGATSGVSGKSSGHNMKKFRSAAKRGED